MAILKLNRICNSCGKEFEYLYPFGSRKEADAKEKYLLSVPGECFRCRIKRVTAQAESVSSSIGYPEIKYGSEKQKEYAKSLRAGYAASHLTTITVVQEYLEMMDESGVKASYVRDFFMQRKLLREYTILTSENASLIIRVLH